MSMHVNYEQWGYGPPHPGEVLRDQILPRLNLTRTQLAERLGVRLTRLSDFLNERRPVSLDLARRLGKAFGNGARYWLAMQMQHDVWKAERDDTMVIKPIQVAVLAPVLGSRVSAAARQ